LTIQNEKEVVPTENRRRRGARSSRAAGAVFAGRGGDDCEMISQEEGQRRSMGNLVAVGARTKTSRRGRERGSRETVPQKLNVRGEDKLQGNARNPICLSASRKKKGVGQKRDARTAKRTKFMHRLSYRRPQKGRKVPPVENVATCN